MQQRRVQKRTVQSRVTRSVSRPTSALLVMGLFGIAIVGCSDDPTQAATATSPTQSSPSTTTATTTSTTAPAVEPTGDALPDGESFGFLQSVDPSARTLSFDLAQLFKGHEAVVAARADGEIEPEATEIANDYYIRNVNPKLRTVAIAPGATVKVLSNNGDPALAAGTLTALALNLVDSPKLPLRVTVSQGAVTHLEQVFFP